MKKLAILAVLTALLTFGALSLTNKIYGQSLPQPWFSGKINALIITNQDVISADSTYYYQTSMMPGDILFTYFEDNGTKYIASYPRYFNDWDMIIKGMGMTTFIESEPGKQDGAPEGSDFLIGVQRGEKLYKAEPTKIVDMYTDSVVQDWKYAKHLGFFKAYGIMFTDTLSWDFENVPYYYIWHSTCPSWRQLDHSYEDVAVGDEIRIHQLRPWEVTGYSYKLMQGNGTIFRDGSYTWRYRVAQGDLNSEVLINVTAKARYLCESGDETRLATLTINAPETGGQFADMTKSEWIGLRKYYLQFSYNGDEAVIYYNKQRKHWPDKEFPAFKVIVKSTDNKYIPPKIIQESIIDQRQPNVTIPLPKSMQVAYIKLKTIEHGYTWQWKVEAGETFNDPEIVPEPEPEPEPEINVTSVNADAYDEIIAEDDYTALAVKADKYYLINKTDIRLTTIRLKCSTGNTVISAPLNANSVREFNIHNYYMRVCDPFIISYYSNTVETLKGNYNFNINL